MNTKDNRLCQGCLQEVTNENLGGHAGKSAMSGVLFCDACAQPAPSTAVGDIFEEFAGLDQLLIGSSSAVRGLRVEPHVVARQARLVLLAREYARDCTVLAHRLNRMAMS